MRRLWVILMALVLMATMIGTGQAAPASAVTEAACARTMIEAIPRLTTAQEVSLGTCGKLEQRVTMTKAGAMRDPQLTYCQLTRYTNHFGIILWQIETCETWRYNGSTITYHMNPPRYVCNANSGYSCNLIGRGIDTVSMPYEGRAWSLTRVFWIWPGAPGMDFTIPQGLFFRGDGTAEPE